MSSEKTPVARSAVRDAVLARVKQSTLRPTELLTALPQYGYSDIQAALTDLLEAGTVLLAADLHLALPVNSPE